MSIILLNLRGVPEDEAEEIRDLLTEHGVAFYETPPSRWGISMGAIWLRDEYQREEAKQLIARYQQERQVRARENHARLKREGSAETLMGKIRQQPLRVLLYLAIVAVILYFSIRPFFNLGE
ncbi:MAG: DUF6164 family protein [Nitrococcus sp.]|nr:DUF6164 family protein [Nitrococcus sp.]